MVSKRKSNVGGHGEKQTQHILYAKCNKIKIEDIDEPLGPI
jgi:hypothetical protein